MSQVTQNKVVAAHGSYDAAAEFWHYFKRNKGAGGRAGVCRNHDPDCGVCEFPRTV